MLPAANYSRLLYAVNHDLIYACGEGRRETGCPLLWRGGRAEQRAGWLADGPRQCDSRPIQALFSVHILSSGFTIDIDRTGTIKR